jgi:hypothetical protein
MRREKWKTKFSFNLWERKRERDSSNQCKAEVLDRKWEDINWSNLESTDVPSRVWVFSFWTILQQIRARLKVENSTNWQQKQNPQRFLAKFTRILRYTDMKKTKNKNWECRQRWRWWDNPTRDTSTTRIKNTNWTPGWPYSMRECRHVCTKMEISHGQQS